MTKLSAEFFAFTYLYEIFPGNSTDHKKSESFYVFVDALKNQSLENVCCEFLRTFCKNVFLVPELQ